VESSAAAGKSREGHRQGTRSEEPAQAAPATPGSPRPLAVASGGKATTPEDRIPVESSLAAGEERVPLFMEDGHRLRLTFHGTGPSGPGAARKPATTSHG